MSPTANDHEPDMEGFSSSLAGTANMIATAETIGIIQKRRGVRRQTCSRRSTTTTRIRITIAPVTTYCASTNPLAADPREHSSRAVAAAVERGSLSAAWAHRARRSSLQPAVATDGNSLRPIPEGVAEQGTCT